MLDIDGVHPALSGALDKRGYETLTPVQEAVIDESLATKDLLVSAQTGSGKTVAFGLALAPNLLGDGERFPRASKPLALVVAPTRELALQVQRELEWLFEKTGAAIASCVGGMDMRTERRALARGSHIVVGTPGRLRDHIDRGSLDMSEAKAVVLDEADEMLDLGFRDDLEFILEATPEDRRTLMFSATVPRSILNLAKRYQNDAERISTTSERSQHVDIEYRALMVSHRDIENGIVNVLRYYDPKNTIVFCATRAAVARMTSRFSNRGFSVVALSGELSQEQRTHALQAMRDGRARVCVATDVAARGIDLPDLELVVHADLPNNKETLLHRSGRTGRAGRKGVCALMIAGNMKSRAERMLRSANVNAEWARPPSAKEILARDDERILTDPSLTDKINEHEREFINRLMAEFPPEQIASAFVRGHRASKSAPEELLEVKHSVSETRGSKRDNTGERRPMAEFENGRWISLSIGRNQRAEPRWILPMICKASNLTKRNIGSIKIRNDETFIEISEHSFDDFMNAVGPNLTLEKSIRVRAVEGVPNFDQEQTRRERGRGGSKSEGRPRSNSRPQPNGDRGSEKKWDKPKWDKPKRGKPGDRRDDRGPQSERDEQAPGKRAPRKGNKGAASRQDHKSENRRNREKALEELSAKSDSPAKKPKKPKKSKTVKFTGLKKKGERASSDSRPKDSQSDGSKGGMAPRKRSPKSAD
jgi:ATP-dependent RNA helicase DeaD